MFSKKNNFFINNNCIYDFIIYVNYFAINDSNVFIIFIIFNDKQKNKALFQKDTYSLDYIL